MEKEGEKQSNKKEWKDYKKEPQEQREPLKKVQIVAKSYYARKDVQQAIFEFCKNRETVPRYLEGFGKRPDMLDYPNDILGLARKGATSFHCSEELWSNPLEISTDKTQEEMNKIKIGWDFLIDIDSKYLDYSKVAAKLIVKALERHGITHIGIKFSGSKGFHLIVPFKAFPKEVSGIQTKDMFPEWARYIAAYVKEIIQDKLTQEILNISNQEDIEKKGKELYEILYKPTGEKAEKRRIIEFVCPNFKCRAKVNSTTKSNRKTLRCPGCNGDLEKIGEKELYVALSNNDNSQKNPDLFEKKATTESLIDSADIILVSSRHLFRAPYSLHEKTSLSSAVVEKEEIENFKPQDADPLKIKVKSFYPEGLEEGEAKDLLLQAIDWAKKNNKIETKKFTGTSIDLKGLTITEEMFPPIIRKLMLGIKDDGRKRALSILVAFFSFLEFPQEYIEEKLGEWNKRNYKPLKEGYLKAQIVWSMRNKRLPPNYDKPIYKEFNATELVDPQLKNLKNPVNYTIREAMRAKGRTGNNNKSPNIKTKP